MRLHWLIFVLLGLLMVCSAAYANGEIAERRYTDHQCQIKGVQKLCGFWGRVRTVREERERAIFGGRLLRRSKGGNR